VSSSGSALAHRAFVKVVDSLSQRACHFNRALPAFTPIANSLGQLVQGITVLLSSSDSLLETFDFLSCLIAERFAVQVDNLSLFIDRVCSAFPNLRCLSMFGNAACPNFVNGGSRFVCRSTQHTTAFAVLAVSDVFCENNTMQRFFTASIPAAHFVVCLCPERSTWIIACMSSHASLVSWCWRMNASVMSREASGPFPFVLFALLDWCCFMFAALFRRFRRFIVCGVCRTCKQEVWGRCGEARAGEGCQWNARCRFPNLADQSVLEGARSKEGEAEVRGYDDNAVVVVF
jgi:hypothetical protein